MNLSAWSIRNPIPVLLLFILLTAAGMMGFRAMKVQNFPDIDMPSVIVSATLPGATPSQLETEVARKIEDRVASLQGVKHIYTHIQGDSSVVTIEFRLETRTQDAMDDVRDAVGRLRSELPADLIEPVISKMNFAGMPILTYTVAASNNSTVGGPQSGMTEENLSWFVDQTVSKALLSVPGVAAVSRVGGVNRQFHVELDAVKMLALQASAAEISRQLKRVQQDAPSGKTVLGGQDQAIRTIAAVQTVNDLGAMAISLSDGRQVRLNQIAKVTDTVADRSSAALINGQPAVAFEIVRSRGSGEVNVASDVRARVERLRQEFPSVKITEAFNFVDPVEENYTGSMYLLYEGALLAVLVVWFFLRDWRSTIVVATALPLSVIPAFAVMHYGFGFTINVVTLLSLSLVVGILVDDAIVEIENITRHLAMDKTPLQAATDASDEIGLAVIATTFTLIAVFLPTAFMGGVAGKFFVQFGWTAAIAAFFSLVVARMLTPMMAAYILSAPKARPIASVSRDHPPVSRWERFCFRWTRLCLTYRTWTVLGATLFFVLSFALVPLIPTGFMPPDNLSQTQVGIELPPGTRLDKTLAVAESARQIVVKNKHVKLVYTAAGGGSTGGDPFEPPTAGEARKATLTLNLTARQDRPDLTKQQIEGQLREALRQIPGARIKVGFGGSSERYILMLASENAKALSDHARVVERALRTLPGIGAITSTSSLTRSELVVRMDSERAANLGVTSEAIGDTLRLATAGDYEQGLAKVDVGARQLPIVVKLDEASRRDIPSLMSLQVHGAKGPVSLGNLATVALENGPAVIDRYDRMRNVSFDIALNQQPLGDVEKAALALPSLKNLPAGIVQTTVGDAEAMKDLFDSFGLAMLTGVMCIYVVLVLLFKDFAQPTTILAALVMSVPGAFLALFVTGQAISMPSMIGLIMLMGVATKNSILLVDYIIIARRDLGMNRWAATLDAAAKRTRPIVMTTVAMGAGMLPIAMGIGVDPSFRSPMAIVVIGGLVTSTFLSLLVVPVAYTYVDDGIQWFRNLRPR